jgi:hypothetical protein
MNCRKTEKLLIQYIDKAMPPALMRTFEEHVNSCPSCRPLVETARKLSELKGKCAGEHMPEDLLKNIRSEAGKVAVKQAPVLIYRYAYISVIAVLAVFAGYYLISEKKSGDQRILTVRETQEKLISVPIIEKSDEKEVFPKIMDEKDIKEKVIELAKLPRQKMDFVFRGSEAVKKRKFIREWKGYSKDIEKEKYLLIGTEKKWYDFWKKHLEGSIPVIDFREYIVLAVFSEASELQITEVKEARDRYLVNIKETVKEYDEEHVSGRPFHVVVLKI